INMTSVCVISVNTPYPCIYPLTLHDALPILTQAAAGVAMVSCFATGASATIKRRISAMLHACAQQPRGVNGGSASKISLTLPMRSEEHTSELQSHLNIVCSLLLEKKKDKTQI